jgi:hypothetical protein
VDRTFSGLFAWTRTGNEYIDEAACTLLPVGTGRNVGHSDQGAEQIEWFEVFPNIATPYRALHKFVNRSGDLRARRLGTA